MSYRVELDPKKEAAARLISEAGDLLQKAFLDERDECSLTFQQLAERLDVDRSHVHRLLSGYNNMTLRTLAELAWGLDREFDLKLVNLRDGNTEAVNGFSHHRALYVATDEQCVNIFRKSPTLNTSAEEFSNLVIEYDEP